MNSTLLAVYTCKETGEITTFRLFCVYGMMDIH